jgi:hypothetical protein
MGYHFSGLISALFVVLSLTGLALQVRFIWRRKRDFRKGQLVDERPTSILSLNRFSTSFLAFYSMLMYGFCLVRLNHYLVWPRVIALCLLLIILYEIRFDRKDKSSTVVFGLATGFAVFAVILPMLGMRVAVHDAGVSLFLVLSSALLLAQGATHQIVRIRCSGRTGALSLPMHQLFFLKDISSMIFGAVMGFKDGWPVLVFHGVSMTVQCTTMWHFRWVRVSPVALERRETYDTQSNTNRTRRGGRTLG